MKPKVVHFTSVHPAHDSRIFYKECLSLAESGFNVVLIAQQKQDESDNGVSIRSLSPAKNRIQRMTSTAWQAYRMALAEGAEIYHFHDPELIPAGLMLAFHGKKVIYDVHEDVPQQVLSKQYLPRVVRFILARLIKCLHYLSAKHFSAVIAVTPSIGEQFANRNPKTVVIRNYPRLEGHSKQKPWRERPPTAMYAGLISRERGIVELVRAMAMLPVGSSARLCLAGRFVTQELFEEVSRLPGWNRVDYLGVLDHHRVLTMLDEVRLGLVVLHPELNYVSSLPIKLFEYMAAGLPVVASNFPLWKTIIQEAHCGVLVNPFQPSAIAAAIQNLLYSPDAAVLGMRGRAAVETYYNWDGENRKLISLYEQLASAA